jgi:hypothetical protein
MIMTILLKNLLPKEEVMIKKCHNMTLNDYTTYSVLSIFQRQVDENKKFAPERSWGKLKTALNVWLLKTTGQDRQVIYTIVVNDLLSQTSVLSPIIGIALEKYRPSERKK